MPMILITAAPIGLPMLSNPWTFTVIAAIVSTAGTILGLFLKDFLFVFFFENLKEKRELEKISKKYKDPLLLSSAELLRRIIDYINNYEMAVEYSTLETLYNKSDKMDSYYDQDPYFLKYKLTSTLYRFCAFFGWHELYRQEITFLNSHSKNKNLKVTRVIKKIYEAIADGQLISSEQRKVWNDKLIFREELRSIGEGMIEKNKEQRVIIGYGKFQALIKNYEQTKEPLWLNPAVNFFTDFKKDKDYRIERFASIKSSLLELIKSLDKDYYLNEVPNKQ